MKLLFDQNLSFKLCEQMADVFPQSNHVGKLGLAEADDHTIWQFAKADRFTIVSQDADFAEMGMLLGSPPKVIWLRAGNQRSTVIAERLRRHAQLILALEADDTICLEIY